MWRLMLSSFHFVSPSAQNLNVTILYYRGSTRHYMSRQGSNQLITSLGNDSDPYEGIVSQPPCQPAVTPHAPWCLSALPRRLRRKYPVLDFDEASRDTP